MRVLLVALLALVLTACGRGAATGGDAGGPRIGPYPADRFYIGRDEFLAADEPAAAPASAADFIEDDDEVFGIVVGGHARAYPIWMLSYHHVVNEILEGIPVAVTY